MATSTIITNEAPKIIPPVGTAPATPAEAAKGESTVTMEFPNDVHLTIGTNQSIFYPRGTHEVPKRYADHWYLEAHGARRYLKPNAVKAAVPKPSAPAGK